MNQWMPLVAIVIAGLVVGLFLPQGAHECLLYSEVICVETAEQLPDEVAAYEAVRQYVSENSEQTIPPLEAFRNADEPAYALSVDGTSYTFTNRATSPQWSVTVKKLSHTQWRVVRHTRFVTKAD